MVVPRFRKGQTFRFGALALAAVMMACQGTPPPRASVSASPSASPSPPPLGQCPLQAASAPQILLNHLPGPDDLALESDGTLLVSDINAGTVSTWTSQAGIHRLAGGLSAPEGIVVQSSGALLVAEQGRNRVVRVDPVSGAVQLWRTFPNHTGLGGIDGLALDPVSQDVIVPDSPNGLVWRMSADGSRATLIASGMVRPVGAAVEADGQILVADEGGWLWRVGAGKRRLASLATPDDVLVQPDGLAVVNTIGDNAIHLVSPAGQVTMLIAGVRGPQGIAMDGAGNVYYTEYDAGRVGRLVRAFALSPSVAFRSGSRIAVCPGIVRAAQDRGPLDLAVTGGLQPTRVEQPTDTSGGYLEFDSHGAAEGRAVVTVSRGSASVSEPVSIGP